MKRMPLLFLFMLAAYAAFPVAADDSSLVPRSDAPVDETVFRVLDINGDGYVSRAETRRGSNLERMFHQLDANRDGRLSREELRGLVVIDLPGDIANRK